MKTKELVCIICPNGCQMQVVIQEDTVPKVTDVTGHLCKKGYEWAILEILNPVRTISGSVLVKQGDSPLVSVKTNSPIPLKKIFAVMNQVKEAYVTAPVKSGDVIIEKVAGLKCNIIATKNVDKA